MKRLVLLFVFGLTIGVVSASADTTLAIPGHANSTPWIASSGSTVAVAWAAAAAGKGDIYLAISTDGGRTFGQPVRVNATPGEARINGEIAPRVALWPRRGAPPVMTVTWNAKDAGTQIKTARSLDGGRTFGAPIALQSVAAGERGWPSSVMDTSGKLHTIWLDHRGLVADAPGTKPAMKGEHDGVAMAQKSGLYYAADGIAERELFKGVCYCCKTAMAIGPKGELYAAWRHVFAGNMRDMGFTMSRDGGRTFSPMLRVNEDGWSIRGCPDDGPAMAVDAKGTVHLVWPTVQNEQGVLLYATSTTGAAFSAPARIPTLGGPKPSHPQVAVDRAGRVFVAWDESREGVRRAAIAGAAGGRTELLGDATTYPVMAPLDSGVVAAWTSGPPDRSVITVRQVR
jgi:hypothetical protein